jgi:hypothetical protein
MFTMPTGQTGQGSTSRLARKITQFRNDASGERNLYPFIRDLLTNAAFGIGLKTDQVVVDSRLTGGRDIPDLIVYSTKGGRAIKTPDHAYGVFEVKRAHDVCENAAAIYEEKKKYIKAGDSVGMAFWINDNGQAVGGSGSCANSQLPPIAFTPHAVLWEKDGSVTNLGNLGGTGNIALEVGNIALSINNQEQVVGGSALPGNTTVHAFLLIRVPLQALEVGANFRSVLVA